MILADVHTAFILTFRRHAGTHYFRQSIDVVGIDPKSVLNLLSHLVCPRLCAEQTCLEIEVLFFEALFVHKLYKAYSIRRGHTDYRSTEIPENFKLTQAVSCRCGNNGSTELFCSVVHTKTACEQSVTVADLNIIVLCSADIGKRSCGAFSPYINIVLCISYDRLLACCTR